jgi:DNA-binding NarL/FixJ family response regulator
MHGIRTVAAGHLFLCTEVGLAALRQSRAAAGLAAPPTSPEKPAGLTKRETEVLHLIAAGLTSGEMADQLFLSKRTIETHRQSLLEKTQAKNTATLIKCALRQGWLT